MFIVPSMLVWSMAPIWAQLGTVCIDPQGAAPKASVAFFSNVGISGDDESDEDNAGEPRKTLFFSSAGDVQAGGPWLGLQFGPVSKAMAAQLRLDAGTGQVVMNVVQGSPADSAGLQQFDIITAIDGQNVSSKIGEFMDVVRTYKPGEVHSLTVKRGGQNVQASVTVGSRPDQIGPSKFKSDDAEWSQGQVFNRSGMLQKDDKGDWVFKGFNMPDMPDLWKAIPSPDDQDFTFNIPLGGPGSKIQLLMKKDQGKTIRVEKADDGKITVMTTTNENGKETTTTKTYANEDELKAADADAAKMLSDGPQSHWQFFNDGRTHIQALDGDIKAHIEEAMKNFHGSMKDSGGFLKKLDGLHGPDGGDHFRVFARKARTSFESTPDGKVKVTTRKGDEELTTVYDNADSLRQANPELHKKFERLQESGKVKN